MPGIFAVGRRCLERRGDCGYAFCFFLFQATAVLIPLIIKGVFQATVGLRVFSGWGVHVLRFFSLPFFAGCVAG